MTSDSQSRANMSSNTQAMSPSGCSAGRPGLPHSVRPEASERKKALGIMADNR